MHDEWEYTLCVSISGCPQIRLGDYNDGDGDNSHSR